MKRATIWPATFLGLAALLAGCDRKPTGSPVDPAEAGRSPDGREQAVPEPPGPGHPVDSGAPAGFIDPIHAKDQIRDPILYASKIDELARQVDPNDAPEYAKKMVVHMREIANRMGEHLDDCDSVVVLLREYIETHRKEFVDLHAQGNLHEAGLSAEERAKLQAQTLLLMAPFAEELARTQSRFAIQCTAQAQAVAGLMKAVIGD